MRLARTLGASLVVALCLTALVGAGTASATELCSTNTSPCTGTKYTSGTTLTAQLKSGTVAAFTNSTNTVTCKKSTLAGKTTSSGGKGFAVSGEITGLTFTECATENGTACTVTSVNKNYSASIVATSGGNGTLTIKKGTGAGDPAVLIDCGFLIDECQFSTASAALGFTGGNPAIAKANGITMNSSSGICPSIANWDAEYEVTAPKPVFAVNP